MAQKGVKKLTISDGPLKYLSNKALFMFLEDI